MNLTDEQANAVDLFKASNSLKISTFAGNGKTSILTEVAKSTKKSDLYLAFNKSIAADASIGHCEGDTVIGSDKHHCVFTMVDRTTGYVSIERMSARTKEQCNGAMDRAIKKTCGAVKTLTLDNGTEFHGYESVEKETGVQFYFATPYPSWERGTNENTNGLIRQYLKKR